MKNNKANRHLFFALAGIVLVGFLLQIEAVYGYFRMQEMIAKHPNMLFCFFGYYNLRTLVILIGILGLSVSAYLTYKNDWQLFLSFQKNLAILSPLVLFTTDAFLVWFFY